MQSIQEIYQNNILPLGENERLKLVEIIVRDINRQPKKRANTNTGSIREMFGTWEGKEITEEEYQNLDHNERIDFDLARAYADNYEDEN